MNLIREFQSGDYVTKTMNTCWAHVSCYVNFALAIMKYMKMVLIRVAWLQRNQNHSGTPLSPSLSLVFQAISKQNWMHSPPDWCLRGNGSFEQNTLTWASGQCLLPLRHIYMYSPSNSSCEGKTVTLVSWPCYGITIKSLYIEQKQPTCAGLMISYCVNLVLTIMKYMMVLTF